MEHRLLLERKSVSFGSAASRELLLADNLCLQKIVKAECRSRVFLCVGILAVSLLLIFGLGPDRVLDEPGYGRHFSPNLTYRSEFLRVRNDASFALRPSVPAGSWAEPAWQGMGTLFRKSTQDMKELIVAHATENVSLADFRMFLRTLHRSGSTAKADVIVLYDALSNSMRQILAEEEGFFQGLLAQSEDTWDDPQVSDADDSSVSNFNAAAFWKPEISEEISPEDGEESNVTVTVPRWGSVMGFEMQELDPDNAFQGFFDGPPMHLRRWLCYQLLLGAVKSKYKHVMLTELEGVVVVGDAFSTVRRKSHIYLTTEDRIWSDEERIDNILNNTEVGSRKVLLELDKSDGDKSSSLEPGQPVSLHASESSGSPDVTSTTGEWRKDTVGRKKVKKAESRRKGFRKSKSPKTGVVQQQQKAKGLIETVYGRGVWNSLEKYEKSRNVVTSGVIFGEIKLMRSLTNKMATEIVRVALERRDRQTFHDKAILNYLVCKSSVLGRRTLDRLRFVGNKESVVHSLRGSKQKNLFWRGKTARYLVVQGYRDELQNKTWAADVRRAVHTGICRSRFSSVYVDCPIHDTGNRIS